MGQTILVTGANGFTGSNLCRRLAENGHRVRALVRDPEKGAQLKSWGVELYQGDLSHGEIQPDLLRGVETVYHLAAAYRQESPSRQHYFDVNLGGTQRLARAAAAAGVSRFVHCSTVGVLGDIRQPPGTEESPYNPHDHYQRSKKAAECLVIEMTQRGDLPGVVVRPGAIYGPGDMRLLKLFQAIDRQVFWMIGPGQVHYHLVYVDDLIEGMVQAGECPEAIGEVFILAGETPIKLWDLVELIGKVIDRPVPKRSLPAKPVMQAARAVERLSRIARINPILYPRRLDFFLMNRAFDISKAQNFLGYQPQFDLETGIVLTAEWYRQNGYLNIPLALEA